MYNNLEETIARIGFCKFDFTGLNKIEALKQLYDQELSNEAISGMMVSHNRGDYERNLEISHRIKDILQDELKQQFPGHRFFIGHFIAKEAADSNTFQLHQDWNIVDETKYTSYQLWIPLQPSYPQNGGMFFIPRSQHFNQALRSGSFNIPRVKLSSDIYPYLSYTRLLPGQAVAFANNLLHGSFSNATPENRLSVLINLVEEKANTQYYHFNRQQNTTEIYPVDEVSLMQHLPALEKGQNPFTTPPVEVLPAPVQDNGQISMQDVLDWVQTDRAALGLPVDYEFKQFQVFNDPKLEQLLNDRGYVVIPLLTEEELKQLRTGFDKYFPDRALYKGRYNSLDEQDGVTRKEIHQHIQNIIDKRLQQFFRNYHIPISIYYSKRPDGVRDIGWHTDPHFVFNQHLEPFYTLWCTLKDIDERHGVLQVVPGSHRLSNNLVHLYKKWSLGAHHKVWDDYGTGFVLKAGEAIVFDPRLVHNSSPNLSDIERDCIVMRVTHPDTTYFSITPHKDELSGDIYKQEEDYFYSNLIAKPRLVPDTGVKTGVYYFFDEQPLSEEAVIDRLSRHKVLTPVT